jgi:hypothetical protein
MSITLKIHKVWKVLYLVIPYNKLTIIMSPFLHKIVFSFCFPVLPFISHFFVDWWLITLLTVGNKSDKDFGCCLEYNRIKAFRFIYYTLKQQTSVCFLILDLFWTLSTVNTADVTELAMVIIGISVFCSKHVVNSTPASYTGSFFFKVKWSCYTPWRHMGGEEV